MAIIFKDLRVSDENRIGEGDVVQFLADLLLHSGGQDCSSDLRLGCREGRFPQYLGRAGEEIQFPVGVDINASSKTQQASVKESEELCRVLEDDLTGKGHGSGEEDLIDGGEKPV